MTNVIFLAEVVLFLAPLALGLGFLLWALHQSVIELLTMVRSWATPNSPPPATRLTAQEAIAIAAASFPWPATSLHVDAITATVTGYRWHISQVVIGFSTIVVVDDQTGKVLSGPGQPQSR